MFSNKIHSVWYDCYQCTETRKAFVLQYYIVIFLKVYNIAIKGLKNENNIFAQYYRRKRLFAKETTMF